VLLRGVTVLESIAVLDNEFVTALSSFTMWMIYDSILKDNLAVFHLTQTDPNFKTPPNPSKISSLPNDFIICDVVNQ
jgi:hypothetical protein